MFTSKEIKLKANLIPPNNLTPSYFSSSDKTNQDKTKTTLHQVTVISHWVTSDSSGNKNSDSV